MSKHDWGATKKRLTGKLSDEEIWEVLAYIKSHWRSREILEARAEMTRDERKR